MSEPKARNDAFEPGGESRHMPIVSPNPSVNDVAEAARWGRVYLIWAVIGLALTILACCLMYIGELGAGFLAILAMLMLSFVARPDTVAAGKGASVSQAVIASQLRMRALELQPALEQRIREWEAIVKDLKRMRRSSPRDDGWAEELDILLEYARQELKASRRRKREHGEAFDTAYYVLQRRDERGRPQKYVVHRGLCPRHSGKDKRGVFGSTIWHGPYREWQDAHGFGTRQYCTLCCSDLPVEEPSNAK